MELYLNFVKITLTKSSSYATLNHMELNILKKAGLTDSQAKGYIALLENGALSPVEIAEKTGETRTNGYAIADKLISLGLARKFDQTKTTIEAENPTKIRSIIIARQQQLKAMNDELTIALPTMLSKFHLANNQPGVLNAEGTEALRLAYNEIIASKDDVLIFPARDTRKDPEIATIINQQIKRQHDAGIKSLALMPSRKFDPNHKKDSLLQVKKLPEGIEFEAQVMIFGNNVVSTVFDKKVVSTIISSPEMAETLRNAFLALWNKC
jgi:sugar-specific transcriptional regulator TrmB